MCIRDRYRIAIEKLLKWKQGKRRKPLIIEGARQVGKTWLMKEFGKLAYADTIYINFDSNSRMAELLDVYKRQMLPPTDLIQKELRKKSLIYIRIF